MGKREKLRAEIKRQLLEDLGLEEIKHYFQEPTFKREPDYNIAQYGNLLIYYDDIRELYKECGYKVDNYSDTQLWNFYKGIVGQVTRAIVLRGER